jgi:hypothetical protein
MLDALGFEKVIEPLDAPECHVVVPPAWHEDSPRQGCLPLQQGENRRYARSRFRMQVLMELTTTIPLVVRAREKHVVLMKDISRDGAGFLHSAQLFPGERVELWFPTGRREYTVARCVRHNDACYEIGAELSRVG